MQKAIRAFLFLTTATLLSGPMSTRAQEKPKADDKAPVTVHPTPLKVQIVFTEFEGDKKVKSMPYTSVFTADPGRGQDFVKLRVGSRVPLYTGKEGGLQYVDVGTNLDCRADRLDDGKFGLRLSLERSWVQGDVFVPVDRGTDAQAGGTAGQFKEPVIGQYKTDVYLLVRDGQTVESTVATDPLTGKVLKIELTLTLLK
jgi:hypothetical protein